MDIIFFDLLSQLFLKGGAIFTYAFAALLKGGVISMMLYSPF